MHPLRQRNSWLWVAVQVITVLALPAVTNYATTDRPSWWPSSTVTWLVAAALALVVVVAAYRDRAEPSADRPRERLAALVRQQWTREARSLEIDQPMPIDVTWSESGRPVAAPATVVVGGAVGGRPKALRLRGGVGDLVAAYRALPLRQLVVLGAPGAGKSVLAMQLTLGLLDAGEVPVLLSLASWDPRREALDKWLARRLAEEYPLARGAVDQRRIAAALVSEADIVPVLDGLDELADALRPVALDALDKATGRRPLVLTCRGDEYEDAVRRSQGGPLSRAAVVEIEPVRTLEAERFLTARGHDPAARWAPVFAELRADPTAPAAAALTKPLMLFLARATYQGAASKPSELLDRKRFPVTSDVEAHLIRGFLRHAYDGDSPSRQRKAVTWLRFLARQVRDRDTGEIRWWTIADNAVRTNVLVLAVMACWFAVVSTVGLHRLSLTGHEPWWSYFLGPAVTGSFGFVLACLAAVAADSSRGRSVNWGQVRRFTGRATLVVLGTAAACAAIGFFVYGWERIVPTSLRAIIECDDRVSGACPPPQIHSLASILSGAALFGLIELAAFALAAPVSALVRTEPDSALTGGPERLFHVDRRAALTRALIVGLPAFGLAIWWSESVADAVLALSGAAWITILALLCSSSTWLVVATVPLALSGRFAWRPLRFLQDAHSRRVLRQVGGGYEFRHKILAEHLADG